MYARKVNMQSLPLRRAARGGNGVFSHLCRGEHGFSPREPRPVIFSGHLAAAAEGEKYHLKGHGISLATRY